MQWYERKRFGDLADALARRHPEREALVFRDRRYSCARQAAEIDRAAKALIALGVERGEHVALWLNNSDDWIFISFALAKIGAVQVPINTRFRARDFEYVLRQSDSVMLITHDRCGPIDYLAMVREVVSLPASGDWIADPALPGFRRAVILGAGEHPGTVSWAAAKSAAAGVSDEALAHRAAAVGPDVPVLIMYTSGTTGFPKGVVHSHKIVRNVEERGFRLAVSRNDVILSYLPLFHAFGYSEAALMSMLTGAKQVIMEGFDAEESLDLVAAERVTMLHGFEAHLKALTEAQESRPRDISSLRTGIFAAGMLSATPVARRGAKALAPLKNISGYGMTEIWLGAGIGSLGDDEAHRCESSGFPGLGYEVRIVDPVSGADRPPGVAGELIVKGYSLMLGYYKKPGETAACFDADGWFHTGDCAQWLDDGYFRFLGRYKDMLKVGGENVDPMEVEGLLLEHPKVRQVAVVGLPDERLSEVPVAFVQPAPGTTLDADEVVGVCRGKVASFKVPRHVVFVDEFPMTASGKIRKTDLREEAKRLLASKATD
jgi:fatty-acyl-CoA synthase